MAKNEYRYIYEDEDAPKKNEKIYIVTFKKFLLKIFKDDT